MKNLKLIFLFSISMIFAGGAVAKFNSMGDKPGIECSINVEKDSVKVEALTSFHAEVISYEFNTLTAEVSVMDTLTSSVSAEVSYNTDTLRQAQGAECDKLCKTDPLKHLDKEALAVHRFRYGYVSSYNIPEYVNRKESKNLAYNDNREGEPPASRSSLKQSYLNYRC